jgi:hypothetical protein
MVWYWCESRRGNEEEVAIPFEDSYDGRVMKVSTTSPADVLKQLGKMAADLADRKCPYMAAVLLQYYDGDFAAETRDERMKAARPYLDQAREQSLARESKTLKK